MSLKRPRELITRILLLLAGLCIAHLGVTLFLQADLGSDPFNVLIQGIFRRVPWPGWLPVTHGRVHMAVSFLIILVLLKVDRSYIRIGTLLCMFLGGPIIDVYTLVLQGVLNSGSPLWVRVPMPGRPAPVRRWTLLRRPYPPPPPRSANDRRSRRRCPVRRR